MIQFICKQLSGKIFIIFEIHSNDPGLSYTFTKIIFNKIM